MAAGLVGCCVCEWFHTRHGAVRLESRLADDIDAG